ncbi:helical backbone metal receptor [Paenibacillus contaminans]|uniref:Ferrichrome ABC transporter substrate-binding protein n=1 Tax=Paenibacillus contaminans TaxID=450362 RepID=A0A329MYX3_9BACL|nr:helical backbone metal receptor [Paenibacillus contaminans]RAV22797.1 ferrichrome ABC transporter substrate-binding protein [Paenibacillus contaminans]
MNATYRKLALCVSVSLLAASVAACSDNQPEAKTSPSASASPGTAASVKPSASPSAAPSFTVDESKATELIAQFGQQAPAKVVSASVAIAEILNTLGVKPVGVPTSTIALADELQGVQKIGSALKPDVEQVTKLQPDVVLGPTSIKDSLEKQFKPANLKTAYIPTDSLEELKLSMVVLSRVFKQEQKAADFFAKLDKQEQEALSVAKGKTAPKVMFLFGSAESFMLMNENTFPGSLAKKLGASNIVSDVLKSKETYVALNIENVVAANPDVILLVAHGDPDAAIKKFEEDVKKNGAWEKLNAFKNGKVKALDYNTFGVASLVKAPNAYKELAEKLF